MGWRSPSRVPKSSVNVEVWREIREGQHGGGRRWCGQMTSEGPEVYTGAPVRVAPWMLPGGASLRNNQLFPRA